MDAPIGLFDSGFGGLTVLREILRVLPEESLIYLADTAHVPYGEKSPETLLYLARENARFLLSCHIKLLLIPCHTICCNALEVLQKELPIPVLGIIEPSLQLVKPWRRVALLGTASMLASHVYQTHLSKQNIQCFPQSCPLFVPLIEEGLNDMADRIAAQTLHALPRDLDAALLACTHYPLMRSSIEKALNIPLLDPACIYAEQVKQYLFTHSLLRSSSLPPTHQFYVTSDPNKFQKLAPLFLGTTQPVRAVFRRGSDAR